MLNGQTARPTGELDAELDELLPVEVRICDAVLPCSGLG